MLFMLASWFPTVENMIEIEIMFTNTDHNYTAPTALFRVIEKIKKQEVLIQS